jgi:hypothetical protein
VNLVHLPEVFFGRYISSNTVVDMARIDLYLES